MTKDELLRKISGLKGTDEVYFAVFEIILGRHDWKLISPIKPPQDKPNIISLSTMGNIHANSLDELSKKLC